MQLLVLHQTMVIMLRQLIISISFSLIATSTVAQSSYTYVEQMPEFKGGIDSLNSFVVSHVEYPQAAIDSNIQGRVVVKFIVSKEGNIESPSIVKHVHVLLDNAAVDVIKQTNGLWNPGKEKGIPVDVFFALPVKFEIREEEKETKKEDTAQYVYAEQMPEFVGGEEGVRAHLAKNLEYPEDAREDGYQGRVIVGFIVNVDGSIDCVNIKKGVCPSIDNEAMRVVKLMNGHWKPGIVEGKKIKVYFQLPITFRLSEYVNDHGHISVVRKILEEDKHSYCFQKGMELYLKGSILHATDYFAEAFKINPNDSESLYYITLIQFQQGKIVEGCKLVEALKKHHHHKAQELEEKYCGKKEEQ